MMIGWLSEGDDRREVDWFFVRRVDFGLVWDRDGFVGWDGVGVGEVGGRGVSGEDEVRRGRMGREFERRRRVERGRGFGFCVEVVNEFVVME